MIWHSPRGRWTALMLGGAVLTAIPVAAQDYAARDVGDWTVAAAKDGQGCFMTRTYDRSGDTTLLLGLDRDGQNHLSVLNAHWSIKPRERLKLDFRLSGGAYPQHFAVGMASDGKRGFVSSFEAKFPGYFARSRMLDIARGDVPVERLALDGIGDAVAELRRCVDGLRDTSKPTARRSAVDKGDDIPRDPFAVSPSRKSKR